MDSRDDLHASRRLLSDVPISRRQFVVGGAVAGLSLTGAGALLGGCGGGDEGEGDKPAALDTTLPKEITMLGWDEYMSPKAVEQFETQTGVRVRLVPYGGVPEGMTMLDEGEVVDIVMAGNAYLKTLKEKGHIQPLQMDLLPNFANVTDEMLATPPYDSGDDGKYSVPYMFGSTGFAVRLDKVADPRESWDMLWDAKFKGGIGMIDDSGECVQAALIKLGKPGNASSPADMEAATQALIEQKPLVKTYSSMSMTDDIKSGMPLRHCWDGDAIRAINEMGLSKIRYVLPKEGFVAWADTLSVHAQAPSPYAAHLFLNHFLDAKVAAENANWSGYQTAVGAADPYIESLVQRAMRPTAEDLARGQWMEVSAETTVAYEKAWKEVKAS